MTLVPGLLGYLLTWVYRRARMGSKGALVLYGMAFSGLLLSGFNEQFFLGLNTILKAIAVLWLLFSVLPWWLQHRQLAAGTMVPRTPTLRTAPENHA